MPLHEENFKALSDLGYIALDPTVFEASDSKPAKNVSSEARKQGINVYSLDIAHKEMIKENVDINTEFSD